MGAFKRELVGYMYFAELAVLSAEGATLDHEGIQSRFLSLSRRL